MTSAWLPRGPAPKRTNSVTSRGAPRSPGLDSRQSLTASATASSVIGMRGSRSPTARTSSIDSTGSIFGLGPDVVRRATSRSSASLG
jgi:hypothetical protein